MLVIPALCYPEDQCNSMLKMTIDRLKMFHKHTKKENLGKVLLKFQKNRNIKTY